MYSEQEQAENEFRNIKLKLKGPNRHSELQAVKALMAMSAQHNLYPTIISNTGINDCNNNNIDNGVISQTNINQNNSHRRHSHNHHHHNQNNSHDKEPMDLSRSDSPEPVYGLSITMTEEEFKELAEREGIKDVIGEPICRLCNGLFSGPLGIALHMCPAMKRQTYRCEICGEDKWKTKANLHSHIKWCKKRLSMKTEQQEKQIY